MKKMLAAVLACVLLLTALPAMADNVRESGDYKYTVKGNGTATIKDCKYPKGRTDVILPNMIDGYTITTIGAKAFTPPAYGCWIASVTLPESITVIEEMAFKNSGAQSINLPDALEFVGYGAFVGCKRDMQFRISNNHPYYALIDGSLYRKDAKELIRWCYVDTFYEVAKIPEGITSIGSYAFSEIEGDTSSIDFPSTLTEIGEGAFYNADNFYSLTFPADCKITTIPDYAFGWERNQTARRELFRIDSLPRGVKQIGNYAFSNVTYAPGEERISFEEFISEVESIGEYAFYLFKTHDNITISIPSTCKTIGKGAFSSFDNTVVGIELADGVERIDSEAFRSFPGKREYDSVYLPKSLTYIANDAFDRDVKFVVEKGSYAERWVKENAYSYTINGEEQNHDWLNN